MAVKQELQATIGFKVPIKFWELWRQLPEEKKAFAKKLFMVIVFGVANFDERELGEVKEIILKADDALLGVMREVFQIKRDGDECREAVQKFLEKLKRREVGISEYNAVHILSVWLKPCFK